MSPTNSESPVRSSQGSSARVRSVTAKQQCSGPMAGRVDDAQADVADDDLVAVRDRLERILGLCQRVDRDRQAVLEREPPVPGHVIGVRVRLEDAHDPHVVPGRLLEVLLDRVGGVDDDRFARVLVPDEIGGAAEIVVDELPEQHVAGRLQGIWEPAEAGISLPLCWVRDGSPRC